MINEGEVNEIEVGGVFVGSNDLTTTSQLGQSTRLFLEIRSHTPGPP